MKEEAMVPPGNSSAVSGVVLTETQRDLLATLEYLDRQEYGGAGDFWWRPLDFGGHDSSHHSATAAQLCKRGLLTRRDRGSISGCRAVWLYRITLRGKQALGRGVPDTSDGKKFPGGTNQ